MAIRDLDTRGLVDGFADEGYGRVVDVFVENFLERGELGAACAVYVDGKRVVDVWGGIADRRSGRAWEADTSVVTFSCSKGILAICAYLLVQAGRLELDSPVMRYWPEFERNGKSDITVRMLLTHRSGLAALDRDLTFEDVIAWKPVIDAIEEQAPLWVPGSGHFYHSMTYGWLIGEVIRRVTGKTPGKFFHDVLAVPLGLRTWIGIPESQRGSVAWTEPPLPDRDLATAQAIAEALKLPIVSRSATMGGAFGFPTEDGVVTFNDPGIQVAEVPGANAISTARSLARLYAGCVTAFGGPRILTRESIDDALVVRSSGRQLFGAADSRQRWGTGFALDSPPIAPLLSERSFGHDGAGGQRVFGDDTYAVGFAYLTNQMGGIPDERANRLTAAVRSCLAG